MSFETNVPVSFFEGKKTTNKPMKLQFQPLRGVTGFAGGFPAGGGCVRPRERRVREVSHHPVCGDKCVTGSSRANQPCQALAPRGGTSRRGGAMLRVSGSGELCRAPASLPDLHTGGEWLCLGRVRGSAWAENGAPLQQREISFEDLVTWRRIFSCTIWLRSFRYHALSST